MHKPTLALLILLSSSLPAQQTQKPDDAPNASTLSTSDPPTTTIFKARTDLVLVPVVVRGKHGDPISGLTVDAFRLEENGKPQTISLFEELQTAAVDTPPTPILDRGYSNLPFDDTHQLRLTIMVLDLLNTTPIQRADGRDLLIKFLSKGLAHNQPVSLLCITGKDLELVYPFTSDATALIAALKKLQLGPERIMPRKDAIEKTLKELTEIAQGYIGIPGRKSMIFAAGDLPEPQLAPIFNPTNSFFQPEFNETFKTLIDANIAVYPFEPLASAPTSRRDARQASFSDIGLRDFASATGGNRCMEANDLMKCFAEAVDDSRSYYMLGFTVPPEDRKPGWRNLSVKVSSEHANIRARSGFFYGNPAPSGTPQSAHDAQINALASPLAYSAVPMYVRVLPPAPNTGARPRQRPLPKRQ